MVSERILHGQVGAAAGNEACSLQVTEVSGTNVTSESHCTICMLDPVHAQELYNHEFPRQMFPKKKKSSKM